MLTVIIVDTVFMDKKKIYFETFVKIYNFKNCRQDYEIYREIELKKIYILTVENPYNQNVY